MVQNLKKKNRKTKPRSRLPRSCPPSPDGHVYSSPARTPGFLPKTGRKSEHVALFFSKYESACWFASCFVHRQGRPPGDFVCCFRVNFLSPRPGAEHGQGRLHARSCAVTEGFRLGVLCLVDRCVLAQVASPFWSCCAVGRSPGPPLCLREAGNDAAESSRLPVPHLHGSRDASCPAWLQRLSSISKVPSARVLFRVSSLGPCRVSLPLRLGTASGAFHLRE